jgi:hypothetical protein
MERLPMDLITMIKQYHSNKVYIVKPFDWFRYEQSNTICYIGNTLKDSYKYIRETAIRKEDSWLIYEYGIGIDLLRRNSPIYLYLNEFLLKVPSEPYGCGYKPEYRDGKLIMQDREHIEVEEVKF